MYTVSNANKSVPIRSFINFILRGYRHLVQVTNLQCALFVETSKQIDKTKQIKGTGVGEIPGYIHSFETVCRCGNTSSCRMSFQREVSRYEKLLWC